MSSQKEGLDKNTQKELLFDIKAWGGITQVIKEKLLDSICNQNTEIYGVNKSVLRKQISNKFDYLKNNPHSYKKLQRQLLGTVIDHVSVDNQVDQVLQPIDLCNAFEKTLKISHQGNTISRYFGKVDFDPNSTIVHSVDSSAWKNRGLLIWKSSEISVGRNPTISTDVYSILIEGIDPRFFSVDNFEPYKATQISPNELVIEYPCAGYDFLFGEFLVEEDSNENQVQEELIENGVMEIESALEEATTGYVVSRNRGEQKAFIIQHNDLTTTDDGKEPNNEAYRTKIVLRFKETLNYGLTCPNNKLGNIDYRFISGDSPYSFAVKWRIAVDGDKKKVVKKVKKNCNGANVRRSLSALPNCMVRSLK